MIEVHETHVQGKPTYNAQVNIDLLSRMLNKSEQVRGSDPAADAWEVCVTWEASNQPAAQYDSKSHASGKYAQCDL